MIGKTISWMSVNGIRSGVIEKETPKGFLVRLSTGKCVIVHKSSIRI